MVDINKLCPHCMKLIEKVNGDYCPYCGKAISEHKDILNQLKYNSILQGKYLVGEKLGAGGFGITYVGFDLNLEVRLAIKEFFPEGYATRNGIMTNEVTYTDGMYADVIHSWKSNFLLEAQALAKCQELSGIVGVKDYFQENDTVYIVMEYVEGQTLKEYISNNGKADIDWLLDSIYPVMMDLGEVHKKGIIHRDISPDNIILLPDGKMKLIDFGASYSNTSIDENMPVLLKPGFAPEEQYRSEQPGPWTDVYALACTIYNCISGIVPQDATERMKNDTVLSPSQFGIKIDQHVEKALMKAMSVYSEDRYDTIENFAADIAYASRCRARYEKAKELLENKNIVSYTEAIDILSQIEEWKDVRSLLPKVKSELEIMQKEGMYANVIDEINSAVTVKECDLAIEKLNQIGEYKDTAELRERIRKKKREYEDNQAYDKAILLLKSENIEDVKQARIIFMDLENFKDSSNQVSACDEKMNYLEVKHADELMKSSILADWQAAKRILEGIGNWKDTDEKLQLVNRRIEEENKKRQEKKEGKIKTAKISGILVGSIAVISVVAIGVYYFFCIPYMEKKKQYNMACELMTNGNYDDAIDMLKILGDFGNSEEKLKEAQRELFIAAYDDIYNHAKVCMNEGAYDEAISALHTIPDYENYLDATELLDQCREELYTRGKSYFERGEYEEAVDAFSKIDNYMQYKDVADIITEANNSLNKSWFEKANSAFASKEYEQTLELCNLITEDFDQIDDVKNLIKNASYGKGIDEMQDFYKEGNYSGWVEKKEEMDSSFSEEKFVSKTSEVFLEDEKLLREDILDWAKSTDDSKIDKCISAINALKTIYSDDESLDKVLEIANADNSRKVLEDLYKKHDTDSEYAMVSYNGLSAVLVKDGRTVYVYRYDDSEKKYNEKICSTIGKGRTSECDLGDVFQSGNIIAIFNKEYRSGTCRDYTSYYIDNEKVLVLTQHLIHVGIREEYLQIFENTEEVKFISQEKFDKEYGISGIYESE